MADKKVEVKETVKCDPVKELAKSFAVAIVSNGDATPSPKEVTVQAYNYANAFENYNN